MKSLGNRQLSSKPMASWRNPESIALSFPSRGDMIWQDAGEDSKSGVSVIGWGDRRVTASAHAPGAIAEAFNTISDSINSDGSTLPDVLGWYGWIGYGVAAQTLNASNLEWVLQLSDPEHPDLCFLEVTRVLVFDHGRQVVTAVSNEVGDDWIQSVEKRWNACVPAQVSAPKPPPRRADARWMNSDMHYIDLVEQCKDAIYEGEAFQMCLTTCAIVEDVTDSFETYRRLRRDSPAPFAMLLQIDGISVLSSSPERFITIDDNRQILSSPIKGTRPRGKTDEQDQNLARELLASEKERAENLMIVDLVRNDFNRICDSGTINVTELWALKSFEHVHQLESTVRGTLRPEVSPVDAIGACFPAGSMTGAPKHRAVRLLSRWESRPRGIYAGAIGSIGFNGTVSLAMTIRTIVISGGNAYVGAGGGITALSVPEEELQEVKTKAAALLRSLGSR